MKGHKKIEEEKTSKYASTKIQEALFQTIKDEQLKIGDHDKIPSIDKIIRIIDISQGHNLKKKLPFYYNYK